jgi:hypothetical protein
MNRMSLVATLMMALSVPSFGAIPLVAVSDSAKGELRTLLSRAPHAGDFYAEKAVDQMAPYIAVLFALTPEDVSDEVFGAYAILSRSLCERKEYREYAVSHFSEIRHPLIKMFWGAVLFNMGTRPLEITAYFRSVLSSKEQSSRLADVLGQEYPAFRQKILAQPL